MVGLGRGWLMARGGKQEKSQQSDFKSTSQHEAIVLPDSDGRAVRSLKGKRKVPRLRRTIRVANRPASLGMTVCGRGTAELRSSDSRGRLSPRESHADYCYQFLYGGGTFF